MTDEQFRRVAHLLPLERGNVRLPARRVLDAVRYVTATGCAWNQLPEEYGPWHTIYTRARRWRHGGLLGRVLAELDRSAPMPSAAARQRALPHGFGKRRAVAIANQLRPLVFDLARRLRDERAGLDMSQLEVAAMMGIEEAPGIGITHLASRLDAHPATVSLLLRGIAAKGWITASARAPGDRRRAFLTLNDAGRKVLRKVRSNRSEQLVRQFTQLSSQQLAILEAALQPLQKIDQGLRRALPAK